MLNDTSKSIFMIIQQMIIIIQTLQIKTASNCIILTLKMTAFDYISVTMFTMPFACAFSQTLISNALISGLYILPLGSVTSKGADEVARARHSHSSQGNSTKEQVTEEEEEESTVEGK